MLGLSALAVSGLSTPAQTVGKAPSVDSSKVGPDGTAYIARVVPVPKTISLEAQNFLAQPGSDVAGPPSMLEQDRTGVDQWQSGAGEVSKRLYPVTVTGCGDGRSTCADRDATENGPRERRSRVNESARRWVRVDSGSLTESIPIANPHRDEGCFRAVSHGSRTPCSRRGGRRDCHLQRVAQIFSMGHDCRTVA